MYRELHADRIIETIDRLRDRIRQRFPEANLGNVADELLVVAKDNARRSREIRRPNRTLRFICGVLVVALFTVLLGAIFSVHPHFEDSWRWIDVIQTLEAGLGAMFFLGAGILFVVTFEARMKRRRCLGAIHEMRAMAHIVDMHQLTKDPERQKRGGKDTTASPRRTMSPFLLSRYLDYCSEMLSLMGKVAALYVQGFPDPGAMAAVDEVENLTTALSRKIWQKIMILEQSAAAEGSA